MRLCDNPRCNHPPQPKAEPRPRHVCANPGCKHELDPHGCPTCRAYAPYVTGNGRGAREDGAFFCDAGCRMLYLERARESARLLASPGDE